MSQRNGKPRRPRARALWLFSAALPLLWGSYLLLVYPPPTVELFVGIGAAVLAAAALAVGYTTLWPGYRLRARIAAKIVVLPVTVLRDFGTLTGLLAVAVARRRPVHGTSRWRSLPTVRSGSSARGQRTASELLASVAPGTIAVGFDKSGRRMLVHELGFAHRPEALERASS